MNKHDSHGKGLMGELSVAQKAIEKGMTVSKPLGEARYDLILDDGKKLYRAQVKYCDRSRNGAIEIPLRRQCHNNGYSKVYTSDEIDVVIVFFPSVNKFCWIEKEIFNGKTSLSIRENSPVKKTAKKFHLLNEFIW